MGGGVECWDNVILLGSRVDVIKESDKSIWLDALWSERLQNVFEFYCTDIPTPKSMWVGISLTRNFHSH